MSLFVFLLWILTLVNIIRVTLLKRVGTEMVGWFLFQLITTLLQIRFEGFVWQMTPIYVIGLFWVLFYFTKLKKTSSIVMVVLFFISSLLIVVFSTPELPLAKGRYVVGTTKIYMIDEARDRELPTQIWYPSDNSQGKSPELWFEGSDVTGLLAKEHYLLPFMLSQLDEVKTNSYKDIEVADGEFPVVVLSHGWSSFKGLHINLCEMLASEGYIVIAFDHTGASMVTKRHTGQVVYLDESLLDFDHLVEDGNRLIELFTSDLAYIMDHLEYFNNEHKILYHHMLIDNVAVIGHSTGGGAVVNYAMTHELSALVGLDPWVEPIEVNPVDEPLLVIRSESWAEGPNNDHLSILTDMVYEPKNSKHQDFTMAYKMSPLFGVLGYTSGNIRTSYEKLILSFLNEHQKNLKNGQVIDEIPIKKLR
jgi:alpha-beta hydrolase superfamily lysophospholipase